MINCLASSTLPALALLACSLSATAATYEFIGAGLAWPGDSAWVAIDGVDDGRGSGIFPDQLDVVGYANDTGGYAYHDGNYLYFRMRLDLATTAGQATFSEAPLVLTGAVDKDWNTNKHTGAPAVGLVDGNLGTTDYEFAWNSKGFPARHGPDMHMNATTAVAPWASTRMDDLDGLQSSTNNMKGDSKTSDGYPRAGHVRATDGISATSFGTKTFLDFTASWAYLKNHTDF